MRICILGASGFLGEALIERMYGDEITVVARDEGKLIALREKYPNIKVIIGDISNKWVVEEAMAGQEAVFHLAAQKHVGLSEEFAYQTVQSNVIGNNEPTGRIP